MPCTREGQRPLVIKRKQRSLQGVAKATGSGDRHFEVPGGPSGAMAGRGHPQGAGITNFREGSLPIGRDGNVGSVRIAHRARNAIAIAPPHVRQNSARLSWEDNSNLNHPQSCKYEASTFLQLGFCSDYIRFRHVIKGHKLWPVL